LAVADCFMYVLKRYKSRYSQMCWFIYLFFKFGLPLG
jgi:hypothetical protein